MRCTFPGYVALLSAAVISLSAESVAAEIEKAKAVALADINELASVPQSIEPHNGFAFSKFYSASEIRASKGRSTLKGDIGVQLGSAHHLHLRSERVTTDSGLSVDRFAFSYSWELQKQTSLLLKSTNIDYSSGKKRTNFDFGLRYKLPAGSFVSSVHLGYKEAEANHTQLEARVNASRNLQQLPLRLSGNIKWRQRDYIAGSRVGDLGGAIGVSYKIKPRFFVALHHNVSDELSADSTLISGTVTRRFGENNVALKIGATSEATAFFRVQSVLDI